MPQEEAWRRCDLFYTVKQIDNSRLVRLVAPNHLRECARVVSLGGLIACVARSGSTERRSSSATSLNLCAASARKPPNSTRNSNWKWRDCAPERIDIPGSANFGLTAPVPGRSGLDGPAAERGPGRGAPRKRPRQRWETSHCGIASRRFRLKLKMFGKVNRSRPVVIDAPGNLMAVRLGVPGENMDLRSPRTRIIVAFSRRYGLGAVFGQRIPANLPLQRILFPRAAYQQRLIGMGASRAEIFDRNMNWLAMSVPVDSAFAVPSETVDLDMVAFVGKVLYWPRPTKSPRGLPARIRLLGLRANFRLKKRGGLAAMNLRGIISRGKADGSIRNANSPRTC